MHFLPKLIAGFCWEMNIREFPRNVCVGPRSDDDDDEMMAGAASLKYHDNVCEVCLKNYPRRVELISEKCYEPRAHAESKRVLVAWLPDLQCLRVVQAQRPIGAAARANGASSGKNCRHFSKPTVRPMPPVNFHGEFRLCNRHQDCPRGDRCTYAHNTEEVRAWNEQRNRRTGNQ